MWDAELTIQSLRGTVLIGTVTHHTVMIGTVTHHMIDTVFGTMKLNAPVSYTHLTLPTKA